MIFPAPVVGWLRVFILAVGCIVLSFAPVRGEEPLGCRKAEGYLIQNYREQYVPKDFPCPSRWWEYADVAALALLLGTGTWLLLSRRPSRWVGVHLACALLYFGIFRGGCICPVGTTANVSLALVHPELIGRATLALFLLPLLAALLCGRIFCGAVCPLGAVQQITAARSAEPLPERLHRKLLGIPVLVLALTALMSVWKLGFLPCLLDPYKPFFFAGHALVQKAIALAGSGFSEPGIVLAGSLTA